VTGRSLRVACVQLAADDRLSKGERVHRVADLIEGVEDTDFVVLPELWACAYFDFDGYEANAEELEGTTLAMLAAAARKRAVWLHGGSLVERDSGGGLYNTSVLLDPAGRLVHIYRKSHLFGNGSLEAELLQPGIAHPGVVGGQRAQLVPRFLG